MKMKQFRSFVWRMTPILVVLGGATYGVSLLHDVGFWGEFLASLLATAFGIMMSATLAYSVWLHQEGAQKELRRQSLARDLRAEVQENLKRLANLEALLTQDTGQDEVTLRVQGLRTAVMKYALNPDNALVLHDPDLEDEIDWVVKQCDEFDRTLARGFERLFSDATDQPGSNESSVEARSRFWKDIHPHVDLVRVLLRQTESRLGEYGTSKG
jgi:hypothetical protein